MAAFDAAPELPEVVRERVARAIWRAEVGDDDLTERDWRASLTPCDRIDYLTMADAAIAAMSPR